MLVFVQPKSMQFESKSCIFKWFQRRTLYFSYPRLCYFRTKFRAHPCTIVFVLHWCSKTFTFHQKMKKKRKRRDVENKTHKWNEHFFFRRNPFDSRHLRVAIGKAHSFNYLVVKDFNFHWMHVKRNVEDVEFKTRVKERQRIEVEKKTKTQHRTYTNWL